MPDVDLNAVRTETGVSLPERGLDAAVVSARYLQITRTGAAQAAGIFEVSEVRKGASGIEVRVQPGQLGLKYGEKVKATVSPSTRWRYRRAQLSTPTGFLIVATLAVALAVAWIDGSIAIGNLGVRVVELEPRGLAILAGVSLLLKLVSATLAFLLALWFKK